VIFNSSKRAFCFASVAILMGTTTSSAGDKKTNVGEASKTVTHGPGFSALATAADLAAYARQSKSAEGLVLAAEIIAATESRDVPLVKGGGGSGDTKSPPSLAQLLKEARDAAGGNESLLSRIAKLEASAPKSRGRRSGPGIATSCVSARSVDTFTDTFRASEGALVSIRGDGDTDLDCWVYDENGNEIDSDTDGTDHCVLSWTPRWRGTFEIRVSNLGSMSNCYTLTTN
jgi:hypothetical protein